MFDTIRNNRVFFCIHLKDDCLSVWFPQGLGFGKVGFFLKKYKYIGWHQASRHIKFDSIEMCLVWYQS